MFVSIPDSFMDAGEVRRRQARAARGATRSGSAKWRSGTSASSAARPSGGRGEQRRPTGRAAHQQRMELEMEMELEPEPEPEQRAERGSS